MSNYYKIFFDIVKDFGLKKFYFIIILFTLLPFVELIGISSLFGYIKILLSNEDNFLRNAINNFIIIEDESKFFLFSSLIVLFLIILRNIYVVLFNWFKANYFAYLGNFLSAKLLKSYFKKDFNFFLKNNSSVLVKNINEETHVFSNGFLSSLIDIMSSLFVSFTMLSIIFYYNFKFSLISITILGGFYLIYYNLTKSKILSLGAEKLLNNNARFQNVSQSIQGIKEIKIFNLEKLFIDICDRLFKGSAKIIVKKFIISFLPRYIVETLVFFGIVLFIFINKKNGVQFNTIIETLTLYILVGYRILPYLEKLFQSVNKIKFSLPTVDMVADQLKLNNELEENFVNEINKIKFEKNLKLEKISFSFNGNKEVLKDINLTIDKGSFVTIIGKTGSGKTTMLNIILGLLQTTSGKFLVDGIEIKNSNLKNWRKNLGYVPQDVYIFEDSIQNNISLYNHNTKDMSKELIKASKQAEIFDFINSLNNKFDTQLGERGANLSGGQKQRLAIARAIFADPEILIFDEATSNLDKETATALINTLNNLKNSNKTIILVTHDIRLTKNCDKIIFLKEGNIHAMGDYEELNESCDEFKSLTINN